MGRFQALELDEGGFAARSVSSPVDQSGGSGKRPWRAAWARYQGRSHLVGGVPCQDEVLFKRYSTGIDIGALADGAGSARLSHYGAAVLVQEASHLIAHDFERIFRATNNLGTIRAEVVGQLQSKLAETARVGIDLTDSDRARLGYPSLDSDRLVRCDLRDLASTLLLVAVKGDRFVALHLGDGVVASEVALRSGRRVVRPLGGPDNGEFANETTFITSRSAAGMLRIYRGHLATSTRTISGFILMSDGPEVSLFQKRTRTLAPACSKLLEACRNLPSEVMQEQLEATLRDVIVPRTSDDCSLVLLAAPHPADADSAA